MDKTPYRNVAQHSLPLPQGLLDYLLLRVLTQDSTHGWGASERISRLTDGLIQVPQGSLYPALRRLERRRLLRAAWGRSAANRRAKYFTLTAPGRAHAQILAEQWTALLGALSQFDSAIYECTRLTR